MSNSFRFNMGIFTLILGGSIALTQSAFTKKAAGIRYGKLVDYPNNTIQWIPIDGKTQMMAETEPLLSGQFCCDLYHLEGSCTAYFPSTVIPYDGIVDPLNGQAGFFRYTP